MRAGRRVVEWTRWGSGAGIGLVLTLGGTWAFAATGTESRTPLGSRVRLASPLANSAVRSSVQRAAERLRRPECQRVFSDFADASGARLQARLDELGQSGEDYIGLV